jgi:hypothetical protein
MSRFHFFLFKIWMFSKKVIVVECHMNSKSYSDIGNSSSSSSSFHSSKSEKWRSSRSSSKDNSRLLLWPQSSSSEFLFISSLLLYELILVILFLVYSLWRLYEVTNQKRRRKCTFWRHFWNYFTKIIIETKIQHFSSKFHFFTS